LDLRVDHDQRYRLHGDMDIDPYKPAIEALKAQIAAKDADLNPLRAQLAAKEAELNPLKNTVNELCKQANMPPAYTVSDGSPALPASRSRRVTLRADHFFNKDPSEAAVEFLTQKKNADSSGDPTPATVDEIFDALVSHGCKFNGSSDSTNKTALKTALTRNTAQIAKISDDLYGLRKWYGLRAQRKSGTAAESASAEDAPDAKVETPPPGKPGVDAI
jgi:hypothetical protein